MSRAQAGGHKRGAAARPTPEPVWKYLGLCAAALVALWLLDLYALRTPVLTRFRERAPLTPLYAFWWPVVRWQALAFAATAALVALSAPRLADPARVGRPVFLAALVAAGFVLPLALFAVRQDLPELGSQFLIYPGEEFHHDARRIAGVRDFLAHYVELMPTLSLHGRHFPPLHALVLYGVGRVAGGGTLPAGAAVLAGFAMALAIAYVAIARYGGEAAGRQGALLLLASPSLLDFSCTSMDAMFLLWAVVAWWLGLEAFAGPAARKRASAGSGAGGGRIGFAAAAGAALLVAASASFSGVVVGFAVGVHGLLSYAALGRRALALVGVVGAAFAAAAVALYAATGFSLAACFWVAREQNIALMTSILRQAPEELYGAIAYGNLAAFAIGGGVALAAALALALRRTGFPPERWTSATLVALTVMTFGGFYIMETERIWMYALPWFALAAVSGGPFGAASLRALVGAGLAQALAMEMFFFTLW